MAEGQAKAIAADVVEVIEEKARGEEGQSPDREEKDAERNIDLLWDDRAGENYGALLAIKVVSEIWQRLGAVRTGMSMDDEEEVAFFKAAYDFIIRFPQAGDEALEIELKSHFDLLLGPNQDPKSFRRLMAARLIRLMIGEFQRALDEEAKLAVERCETELVRVVERDEVNYLPEDVSCLSEMGQRQEAVSAAGTTGRPKDEAVSALAHEQGTQKRASG